MGKILVAYFSASGVTKKAAEELAELRQAELFEICPQTPYTKEAPHRVCCTGQGRGLSINRETVNCWYLDNPPHGLPERYRKVDEYRLLSNKHAIYSFGRDSFRLITEWNKATSATT